MLTNLQMFSSMICFPNRNGQVAAILDQKNYVEELNRQLKYFSFSLPYCIIFGEENVGVIIAQPCVSALI